MRLVLDACVIYPTVMRSVLLGAAGAGFFEPLWSDRILEEWRRAAARSGPEIGAQAGVERALLQSDWPRASVALADVEETLWLPDPDDIHVLETAISADADGIVTQNIKDFPTRVLGRHSVLRFHPDTLLLTFFHEDACRMRTVIDAVLTQAQSLSSDPLTAKGLLKKTRLPRLAKAYGAN